MAYFTEQRKGEINELRTLLQQAQIDQNDEEKQREGIKKVIAAMTLGMDVSPLFSEMIMASNTRDLVVKKMIYLYLTYHAREHPETALLAINTLLKDYADDSPMVRGLALRALASLRQKALVEHVILPLKSGLVDVSPYVRRTAVLGCAKVFQLAPDTIKDPAIINKLYEMLRDKDPQVMVNAAVTLDEILRSDGRGNLDLSPGAGIQLNKKLALHLMERLSALDQWGQCLILDYLTKYAPDEDELFPFMNMLDTRLQSIHVSVVFAVIKLFLVWTAHLSELHRAVYARVKQPLLLLMHAQHAELHAAVLHHIKLITHHVPDLFAREFKRFYCRVSDPAYLRRLKIDILTAVADADNGAQIIDELSEYVHDRHVTVAQQAVLAIGRVGEVTPVTERAVTALSAVLDYFEARDLNQGHARDLRDAALIALADVCRVRPESSVLSCVPRVLTIAARDRQLSPAALTAVASLLGGPAAVLDESPYAAEDWARHVTDLDASSLTAFGHSATALMLKRPAEVKPWLGGLLENCIERPESNALARDQATWLYNLLSLDVGLAKQVLFTEQSINRFAEDQPLEIIDRLFEEFNSLSVIYGEPSERFIETRAVSDTLQDLVQDSESESDEEEEEDEESAEEHVTPGTAQHVTQVQPSVSFKAQVTLDAKSFEGHWKTLKECGSVQLDTQLATDKPQSVVESIEAQIKAQRLHVMAKGVAKQVIKFYLYTQLESSDMLVLVEMIVDLTQQRLTAKFKSPNLDPDYLRQFLLHFQAVITPIVQ